MDSYEDARDALLSSENGVWLDSEKSLGDLDWVGGGGGGKKKRGEIWGGGFFSYPLS